MPIARERMATRGTMYPQVVELSGFDPLIGYRISDRDSDNADFNYYGYLDADGGYYIMQENLSNGAYRYTKGTSEYATAWTNRSSQSYDYFNVIF